MCNDCELAVALAYQQAGACLHDKAAAEMELSKKYRSGSNPWFSHIQRAKMYCENADAILALAPAEPLAEVERMRAERDSFRAVLEGACYGAIDGIAKNSVEMSRMLGDAVMQMTKARLTRAEAAEAEVARLRGALEWYDDGSSMGTRARAALTTPEKGMTE